MMTGIHAVQSELVSFASLRHLLLEMAHELSVDALLGLVVERLAAGQAIAEAQVWLLERKALCPQCPAERGCPWQTSCLRLAARAAEGPDGQGIGPPAAAPPPGTLGAVERIAATGLPIEAADARDESVGSDLTAWLARNGVSTFSGQPLRYKGEVLGVLTVFSRVRPSTEQAAWLRVVADHAAAAVANARGFEEIQRLKKRLELERDYLREEIREAHSFGEIIGRSAALANVLEQIDLVAPTDASVLILGESGTGKELVAREIHKRSLRRDHPMVKVNCASIPRELYESEFFGHVRGAFTGALKDRAGRFELADGGTLFLDEVGEIPYTLQGKLLRVLQEGEFERVGEESTRRVDVRIIAASNRDLKQEAASGRFRHDLYYRLNVFPIDVAPLRRHKEDIPVLAAHFVEQASRALNRPRPALTRADIVHLQGYDWPGNVRELRNVIERAVITARDGRLRFDLFGRQDEPREAPPPAEPPPAHATAVLSESEMRRRERENVRAALERSGWRIYGPRGAAALLSMKPTTLASRIRKMGLAKPRPGDGSPRPATTDCPASRNYPS
jgi:transcriptional regulator with GAF, ATPase, and Fis domain